MTQDAGAMAVHATGDAMSDAETTMAESTGAQVAKSESPAFARRGPPVARWSRLRAFGLIACLVGVAGFEMSRAVPASPASDSRPYDTKLLRLAELIGSIHYLSVLCAKGPEAAWRDRMMALLDAEGTSAVRGAMLTHRFNRGYRNYSRNYRDCTPTAETTVTRFFSEAAELTEDLLRTSR